MRRIKTDNDDLDKAGNYIVQSAGSASIIGPISLSPNGYIYNKFHPYPDKGFAKLKKIKGCEHYVVVGGLPNIKEISPQHNITSRLNKAESFFKRKGFVQQDLYSWLKGFTFVIFENEQFKIGFKMGNKSDRLTVIDFEDIEFWLDYYNRM